MEQMIEKLIDEFTQGRINRRQLVKNLAFTAAAAAGAGAIPAIAAEPALKASSINHISYQVKDYKKSRDYYVNMLGMKVAAEDEKKQRATLELGGIKLIVRNASPSMIDHISYNIDGWNKSAVEAKLKSHGADPKPEGENGWQFKDPDGMHVQLQGKA
jgi:catechol 2,3-dioxygenase-like lactoylglutathione lyase family enzyme